MTQDEVEKITREMVAGAGLRWEFYDIIRMRVDEADHPIYRVRFESADGLLFIVRVDMNNAEPVRSQVSRRIDELKALLPRCASNPS